MDEVNGQSGRPSHDGATQRRRRRWRVRLSTAMAVAVALTGSPVGATTPPAGEATTVIVRHTDDGEAAVRASVRGAGGRVTADLDSLDTLVVELPAGAAGALTGPDVISATPDGGLRLLGRSKHGQWKPDKDLGSFATVVESIGATDVWGRFDRSGQRYTGRGIGVALIDSGVAPVEGLTSPGKVINGPDLSFESQDDDLRYLDTFGHGTHMAGIIAGRDAAVRDGKEKDAKGFVGVAPGAHIVSLKVATTEGITDVSQVIAAIDWVVQHKDDPGLDIRVLNLSYGTESLQAYELDPLAYAAEVAWRHGIVVVVAAGNDGADGTTLNNPAIDPFVIAVGASDHAGTPKTGDDRLADFSSVGNGVRQPDLVAPGRSIVSLRAPGSFTDTTFPEARVSIGDAPRFFRGSGTSQAAAVVSGAVALVLDERPELTPDQVKHLLTRNAEPLAGPIVGRGAGVLQLTGIEKISAERAPVQGFAPATGLGSLELARGDSHVFDPATGIELVGEQDIFGAAWDPHTWAGLSWRGLSWRGGQWNGNDWTGAEWTGSSWTGLSWRGLSWRDSSWTGLSWRGLSWRGLSWRDSSWTAVG